MTERITIEVNDTESTSATLYRAARKGRAGITLILGHGAGTGQHSLFLVSFANALAERGLDVLTFNFLYTEQGKKLPDRTDKLELCYRKVIDGVRKHKPLVKNGLAIGGKSMGGRIASQVAAAGVGELVGLVFLGYPLHPPGKPDQLRSKHLPLIKAPMLFVQGSKDVFGTTDELRPIAKKLKARIFEIKGGDHSFKVPKSTGISQGDVYAMIQDEIAAWLKSKA
jgi:predicted alpha/beta-hydrolase family hydrolase